MTLGRELLAAIFRKNNLVTEYREQEPIFVWTEVAGELGKIARPKKVKGNSLILEVPSAAAKQELTFLEEEFLEKLNENLTETRIEKLKFQLGQFPRGPREEEVDFDIESVELSEAELEEIDRAVEKAGLADSTRESLKSLLITQQKKRKVRLESGWSECPSCGGIFPGDSCPYCGLDRG